ncbi:MAG: tRNA dihydrouridine synthase DusB [Gammaproteobacteria bacterium]
MKIGPYQFENNLALAPMAGVTDRPFRDLCKSMGASFAPSEMVTSDTRLWHTDKSRRRMDHDGEGEPRVVQIAGADPAMMANAAKLNVQRGAQIIDINLGCPAKKVCKRKAGSWLLNDEDLVRAILEATVDAVDVPVTLKTRTGWSPEKRNGVRIAQLAQDAGIAALAVHGRTRECRFGGDAEYETIREIKQSVTIPVWVNGDIDSKEKARQVLNLTGADGVMIGRAAQGRPWIFREIAHHLNPKPHENVRSETDIFETRDIMRVHLQNLYAFYGEHTGVRVARKHLGWYLKERCDDAAPGTADVLAQAVRAISSSTQMALLETFFTNVIARTDVAA